MMSWKRRQLMLRIAGGHEPAFKWLYLLQKDDNYAKCCDEILGWLDHNRLYGPLFVDWAKKNIKAVQSVNSI